MSRGRLRLWRCKLPWVELTDCKPVIKEYSCYRDYWPNESHQRLMAASGQ